MIGVLELLRIDGDEQMQVILGSQPSHYTVALWHAATTKLDRLGANQH